MTQGYVFATVGETAHSKERSEGHRVEHQLIESGRHESVREDERGLGPDVCCKREGFRDHVAEWLRR